MSCDSYRDGYERGLRDGLFLASSGLVKAARSIWSCRTMHGVSFQAIRLACLSLAIAAKDLRAEARSKAKADG